MSAVSPARPSLRQLEYCLATVEHGSFAAASMHLHIARPSLSDQIKRLERLVGGVGLSSSDLDHLGAQRTGGPSSN